MCVVVNSHWIKKTVLYNGRMTIVAFQLMQSKSCTYSQMKTHYDTLEVSPKATQDEIKTSYYKLSMLYHPDKNKSELAKKNFQNISEAYETLSNTQARKRYDRSMMIKQNVQKDAPKATYTYASIHKSKVHPMSNKHFNFDVWNEKHYGQAFVRQKEHRKWFSEEEIKRKEAGDTEEIPYFFVIVPIIIAFIVTTYATSNDYDVPIKRVKEK